MVTRYFNGLVVCVACVAFMFLASCLGSVVLDPCPGNQPDNCQQNQEEQDNNGMGGSYSYVEMPFMADTQSWIIQGNFGGHSHMSGTGEEYGWDWVLTDNNICRLPLISPVSGTVVEKYSGCDESDDCGGTSLTCGHGFGNYVIIEYEEAYRIIGHFHEVFVVEGQEVEQGQVLGLIGSTGYSSGAHIHDQAQSGDYPGAQSIASDYHTQEAASIVPQEGQTFTSANNDMFQAVNDEYAGRIGRATNSIHFYYSGSSLPNSTSDVYVQDHDNSGSNGTTSAVIYDAYGGARKAYHVHSGFWAYYSQNCGGPNGNCSGDAVSDCGAPINDEYSQGAGTARQDFQQCYMYWNGASVSVNAYPEVAPGWFDGSGWNVQISYAFAQAYERVGARNSIGEAFDNGTGAGVHHWADNSSYPLLQDFSNGTLGSSVIMHRSANNEAYTIHTGFWEEYKTLGPEVVGAPCEEEHSGSLGKAEQEFEYLTMYWEGSYASVSYKEDGGCGEYDSRTSMGDLPSETDTGSEPSTDCDQDNDGRYGSQCEGTDCDDLDPSVYTGATEVCGNSVDEDCSGGDMVCSETACVDSVDNDADGYTDCADADCTTSSDCSTPAPSDYDGDGFVDDEDCGWWSANIYPGAPELADWVDNDCDTSVDEGCNTGCAASYWSGCVDDFRDYYTTGSLTHICTGSYTEADYDGDGYPDSVDCAWWDSTTYSEASERADWNDNDCDGTTDEGCDGHCSGNYSGCSDDYAWWYLGTSSVATICY